MPLTPPRRWAIGCAAGLGVVLSAGVAVAPAQALDVPATATYALDRGSIFAGQSVKLTRLSVTGNDDDGLLFSSIDWGDGSDSSLYGAESVASHVYTKVGTFRVAVEVTDLDGAGKGVVAGVDTVRVDRVAGTYRLSSSSVWRGWRGTQPITLSLADVPTQVTAVRVGWGDGTRSVIARNSVPFTHQFAYAGLHTVAVSLIDGAGESSPLAVGAVRVSSDYAAPSVRIVTPARANRASSWGYVRGTIADSGSGASVVTVVIVELRGKKTYYYNGAKWIKAAYNRARPIRAAISRGAWSVRVKGLKRGTLVVSYTGADRVDNVSDRKTKIVKITR